MADNSCPIYKIKRVQFFGRQVPIILQNENGPCPLLAIANVLLLRNTIQLPEAASDISQDRLLGIIGEHLLDVTQEHVDPSAALNNQQNVSDAIANLPKLTTGVDVNVKFDMGPSGFEFTDEVTVFDILGISLVHGWLMDPEDEGLARAICGRSYNELVCWMVGQDTEPAQTASAPSRASSLPVPTAGPEGAGPPTPAAGDDTDRLVADLASRIMQSVLSGTEGPKGAEDDRNSSSVSPTFTSQPCPELESREPRSVFYLHERNFGRPSMEQLLFLPLCSSA
uniref:Protein fam63b-like n=1 Tax=Tetraselmis sp. GSL018 TaxID=582737 RepID=A0A061R138_9CHLO|mmetsp:Transcript_20304/g.48352  ORF Transcript_20304/g.48352 Transcript_20304/m.48352 type:complete len:282 (-) Transcript_20304:891-1736(-)